MVDALPYQYTVRRSGTSIDEYDVEAATFERGRMSTGTDSSPWVTGRDESLLPSRSITR